MSRQLSIYEVIDHIHTHENNPESQAHLEESKRHFKSQNILIYEWLKSGKTLTSSEAMNLMGVGHLARRIADLREGGVEIKDRWLGNGHKRFKSYYIEQ